MKAANFIFFIDTYQPYYFIVIINIDLDVYRYCKMKANSADDRWEIIFSVFFQKIGLEILCKSFLRR